MLSAWSFHAYSDPSSSRPNPRLMSARDVQVRVGFGLSQ
jgi:hypothetical protein